MKRYKAVLFDLFNTVALWRPERMPKFTWDGETRPSTMGALREVIAREAPTLAFEVFYEAMLAANDELAERRQRELREITSVDRFRTALVKAGRPLSEETTRLALALSARHMELLSGATDIPAEHTALLERLAVTGPLALVSNFDHGPTARRIVERDGAAPFLDPIVISDDHGWRKPHPKIFTDTLEALGVDAGDALFVGDSVADDVTGAHGVGMDVAWVNARGESLPAGIPAPAYEVAAITALEDILGG